MKATFNTNPTESSPQITTNTLTFDNGQVKQSSTTNQLKGKSAVATPATRHVSNVTASQNNKKPPLPLVRKSLKENFQFIRSNFQENYFITKRKDVCVINSKKYFTALLLFRLEYSFFFLIQLSHPKNTDVLFLPPTFSFEYCLSSSTRMFASEKENKRKSNFFSSLITRNQEQQRILRFASNQLQ